MRTLARLAFLVTAVAGLAAASAGPATAAADGPVRAGRDDCGNFQIWINGSPTIHYLICNPPA